MSKFGLTQIDFGNCLKWLGSVLCLAFVLLAGVVDTAHADELSWIPPHFFKLEDELARGGKRSKTKRPRSRRSKYRNRSAARRSPAKSVSKWKPYEGLKGPVQVVISLEDQQASIFKGGELIASSPVSTGRPGYQTPSGIFTVIQKHRRHYSNLYDDAPMPHMQRLTWSGLALHGGYVPNYPASHGCVRLPYGFAKKLFSVTKLGVQVVIGRHKALPVKFAHPKLFQATPPVTATLSGVGPKAAVSRERPMSMTDSARIDVSSTATISMRKIVPENNLVKLAAASSAVNKIDGAIMPGSSFSDMIASAVPAMQIGLLDQSESGGNQILAHPKKSDNGVKSVKLKPEPRSTSPLRILVTRRTRRERLLDVQRLLSDLEYMPGPVDGVLGRLTRAAIKRFQGDRDLPKTGKVTEALVAELFRAAGIPDMKAGHLYVRQDHKNVFDVAVGIKDREKPLGTHVFTAMHFVKGVGAPRWTAQTVKQRNGAFAKAIKTNNNEPAPPAAVASTASEALDRIEIPETVRERIAMMLMPGSSMIVTDNGIGRETGRGTDFIVRTF